LKQLFAWLFVNLPTHIDRQLVIRGELIQEAQLLQRDRAAACFYLTLLYVTALTSRNHHFTVLRHHVCTWCKINQHL